MKKFIVLLTVVSLFLTGYACAEGLGSLFGGLTLFLVSKMKQPILSAILPIWKARL